MPEGVREAVHRPPRAAQAQHVPLAPHRRPGLAHRDQEVPAAHRGRRVAQGDDRRPHEPRHDDGTTASRTAASTRRTTIREIVAYARRALRDASCRRSRCRATRRRRSPRIRELGRRRRHRRGLDDVGRRRRTSSTPTEATFAFMQDVLDRSDGRSSRASTSTSAATRRPRSSGSASPRAQAAHQGARPQGRARAAELVHPTQMDAFLTAQGRRLIGWDEILEGGLAAERGGDVVARRRGRHRGRAGGTRRRHGAGQSHVLRPLPGSTRQQRAARDRRLPAARHGLRLRAGAADCSTPQQAQHILGAQAQLWTEYIARRRSTSSTWRSRALSRSPRCCGRRRRRGRGRASMPGFRLRSARSIG